MNAILEDVSEVAITRAVLRLIDCRDAVPPPALLQDFGVACARESDAGKCVQYIAQAIGEEGIGIPSLACVDFLVASCGAMIGQMTNSDMRDKTGVCLAVSFARTADVIFSPRERTDYTKAVIGAFEKEGLSDYTETLTDIAHAAVQSLILI
ncbi:MAG: hypothetical protein V4621_04585 [Pseudomonadota bacterium]